MEFAAAGSVLPEGLPEVYSVRQDKFEVISIQTKPSSLEEVSEAEVYIVAAIRLAKKKEKITSNF